MRLDGIDWWAVLTAAAREATSGGLSRRALADLTSLSALFTDSFPVGVARVVAARTADPFDPTHGARFALLLMRFGDWSGAAELAQSLVAAAPDLALPGYLLALATLRQEEPRRAANLGQDVLTAHPRFAPAGFLRAEALARTQLKGVRKHLAELPRHPDCAPAWADLTVKMLLSGSDDLTKVAAPIARDTRALPPGSPASRLVDRVEGMTEETAEQLEQRLGATPVGSRAEEVVLLVLHDRLQKGPPRDAVVRTRALFERVGAERPSVRRLYVSFLTRLAVAEATAERFADALRLVEACLRLEPHETAHYQNRAALFSLMREPDAYHRAWYELNRHQYRLALLGKLSAADAARLAKPHWLFAQQARTGPDGSGIFSEPTENQERTANAAGNPAPGLNQAKLDDDPDLLRQWIHHHRAELVFAHLALGPDPRRFLLHPNDRRTARARAAGLTAAASSLSVLVPVEGQLLADRISSGWAGAADRVVSAYGPTPDDPDVKALQTQYVQTFADLSVLCWRWRPDGRRPELADEVIAFLTGLAPFFDERAIATLVREHPGTLPFALRFLTNYLSDALGLDPARERALTEHERARAINGLIVELLTSQAYATYQAFREAGTGVVRATALVDRARELDPDNLTVLITSAELYWIGGYYTEAEAMIARAQRSPRAKSPNYAEKLDGLKQRLDERRKANDKGRRREDGPDAGSGDRAGALSESVSALEQEIERFPSSVQSYEELAKVHAAAGDFAAALEWSALATDRCTSRDGQVRARALNLEVLGLEALAARDPNAARLYLAGVHRPALELIAKVEGERPYPLSFLLGRCLLALDQPERAREEFERALAGCGRSAHRVVLRRLAADVDQAYLLISRRTVQDKLAAGAFDDALAEVGGMMARLRRPEAVFIDLARVHTAAATARLGTAVDPMPRPARADAGTWEADLAEAYTEPTDRGRGRRLAELARRADPDSVSSANQVLQRLDLLDQQAAVAEALARSGELLRAGKTEEALHALDFDTVSGTAADPRVVRQRALILLKLERFDEADAAVAPIRGSTAPVAREFLGAYPGLAFRQRVAVACRLIRAGDDGAALEVLAKAVPRSDEEQVEHAYCRGFCRAMAGFRSRRQGRTADARRALADALRAVEPHVPAARALKHARLLDLYEQLDTDPDLATLGEYP